MIGAAYVMAVWMAGPFGVVKPADFPRWQTVYEAELTLAFPGKLQPVGLPRDLAPPMRLAALRTEGPASWIAESGERRLQIDVVPGGVLPTQESIPAGARLRSQVVNGRTLTLVTALDAESGGRVTEIHALQGGKRVTCTLWVPIPDRAGREVVERAILSMNFGLGWRVRGEGEFSRFRTAEPSISLRLPAVPASTWIPNPSGGFGEALHTWLNISGEINFDLWLFQDEAGTLDPRAMAERQMKEFRERNKNTMLGLRQSTFVWNGLSGHSVKALRVSGGQKWWTEYRYVRSGDLVLSMEVDTAAAIGGEYARDQILRSLSFGS